MGFPVAYFCDGDATKKSATGSPTPKTLMSLLHHSYPGLWDVSTPTSTVSPEKRIPKPGNRTQKGGSREESLESDPIIRTQVEMQMWLIRLMRCGSEKHETLNPVLGQSQTAHIPTETSRYAEVWGRLSRYHTCASIFSVDPGAQVWILVFKTGEGGACVQD